MSKPEVGSCPFCNSAAGLQHILAGPQVHCSKCHARGPAQYSGDAYQDDEFRALEDQAVADWNAVSVLRAERNELLGLLREAREIIDVISPYIAVIVTRIDAALERLK